MTNSDQTATLASSFIDGERDPNDLDRLNDRDRTAVIDELLSTEAGRRWLRGSPTLDHELAGTLIQFPDDFQRRRRDATLDRAVELAEPDDLINRAAAVAAGSAAPVFWSRLARMPEMLLAAISAVIQNGDATAIEATATHLLLDPVNPYRIDTEERQQIAIALLDTRVDSARGVAAEFLASAAPERLSVEIDRLARDLFAPVRGFSWLAAFRTDRDRAMERAIALLGDESLDVEIRRSALNTAGEAMSTERMTDILSYFVIHPSEALALDAAQLLHRHHRHPEIAIAAAGSPHEAVREIANRLMDPYRGSPAAGGSRPGDPLRTDPLLKIMRQLEDEETRE